MLVPAWTWALSAGIDFSIETNHYLSSVYIFFN